MAADSFRLDQGRQALCATLDRIREQIDRDLGAEKDRNNRLIRQFLRSARDGIYDDLLLQELTDSESNPAPTHPSPERPPPPTAPMAARGPLLGAHTSSADKNSDKAPEPIHVAALRADHAELRHKFKALDANFKIAKAALRKRVHERDGWASRVKYLERLISTAEKKHGIQILHQPGQSSPFPTSTIARARDTALTQDFGASASQQPESAVRGLDACSDPPTVGPERTVPNEPNEQAEPTQGDDDDGSTEQLPQLPAARPNDRILIKREPSCDEPLLVSERVVRKRKRGDPVPPTVAKTESTDSSSPILSRIRSASGTQDDVDLGDIEQRIVTPRKQKETQQFEPADRMATPKLATSSTARSVASTGRMPLTRLATLTTQPSVLTPLSANVQRHALTESKSGGRTLKRGTAFAISVLAEDGDSYGGDQSATKSWTPTAASTSAKTRLHTLLDSPSAVPGDSVITRSAIGQRKSSRALQHQLPVPERRRLPFSKDSAPVGISPLDKACSTPRLATTPNDNKRSPRPRDRRQPASSLRAKPPSQLRLDDFKVNPMANDGHDFAFADVVRHKGERACLPGCTDLHCCGKQFRALALSQRPDLPLTSAQRMEEQKLLEEYLGDRAYRLASMGKEERAELWVDAKTQELANKYGKHRHRFSRMQSPPGFWNADFPSTQELEGDRAEAAKRERRAIAERHREAMRPGGRWLFKDE